MDKFEIANNATVDIEVHATHIYKNVRDKSGWNDRESNFVVDR